MPWVFLGGAIVTELFGTLGLRGIAKSPTWWAIVLITIAYVASFSCLAVALRQLNVGVVYAVWSAIGIASVSIAGVIFWSERLSVQAIAGLVIIGVGVAVLVSSGTVRHA